MDAIDIEWQAKSRTLGLSVTRRGRSNRKREGGRGEEPAKGKGKKNRKVSSSFAVGGPCEIFISICTDVLSPVLSQCISCALHETRRSRGCTYVLARDNEDFGDFTQTHQLALSGQQDGN